MNDMGQNSVEDLYKKTMVKLLNLYVCSKAKANVSENGDESKDIHCIANPNLETSDQNTESTSAVGITALNLHTDFPSTSCSPSDIQPDTSSTTSVGDTEVPVNNSVTDLDWDPPPYLQSQLDNPPRLQDSPPGSQDSPSISQDSLLGTEDSSSGAHDSPAGKQDTPSGTQDSPTATQGSLSCAQDSPSGKRDNPTGEQGSPLGTQDSRPETDYRPCFSHDRECGTTNTSSGSPVRTSYMDDTSALLGASAVDNDSWNPSDTGTPTVQFRKRIRLSRRRSLPASETLRDVLLRLETKIELNRRNIINVNRANVLDGGFRGFSRMSFDPWNKLSVRFVDEDGIDDGGPTREFMRLTVRAIRDLPIFEGDETNRMITMDYQSYDRRLYFKAGQMLAYFLVHRGPTPSFFSPLLYSVLADGAERAEPSVQDINDYDVRKQVEAISMSTCADEFHEAVLKACDVVAMAGCTNLAHKYSPLRQEKLIRSLCTFLTVDRAKKALDQFEEGLQTVGILDELRANRSVWKEIFIYSPSILDATQVELLFNTTWSTEGSNRKGVEKRIISYWRDFLQDLSDGLRGTATGRTIVLSDLLVFCTGSDVIPVLGFEPHPVISIIHEVQASYLAGMPMVNTCALELRLPVVNDYDTFKENMSTAVEMVCTFTTH